MASLRRSTCRYGSVRVEDRRLVERIHELACQYPRYGYQMLTDLLRGQGWKVSKKRVFRLYRNAGLTVRRRGRRKMRIARAAPATTRRARTSVGQWTS